MKRETVAPRIDAREACQRIAQFAAGRAQADLSADAYLQSATYWQLKIVGDAINKATREEPGLHDVLPEASEIVGIRNRIVHGYAAIRDEIVWDTVQSDLPVLRASDIWTSTPPMRWTTPLVMEARRKDGG